MLPSVLLTDLHVLVCRYASTLELSCLPEMVFGDNHLRLELVGGAGVEFNALDALRCVKNEAPSDLKVATAEAWQKTRLGVRSTSVWECVHACYLLCLIAYASMSLLCLCAHVHTCVNNELQEKEVGLHLRLCDVINGMMTGCSIRDIVVL